MKYDAMMADYAKKRVCLNKDFDIDCFWTATDFQQVTLKTKDSKGFLKINILNVSAVEILNSVQEGKGEYRQGGY